MGNPGNAGEWAGGSYGGYGPDRICGSVSYTYNIGKYEVTAGQYTEFLNAVAKTDTYGLYSTNMWSGTYGCKIEQTGSSGSYSYSVASDWANRPVGAVSWGDAARFANWLTNGQGSATTETGSYTLNGAVTDAALLAVTRTANARYVIPTEDEWYKAAYYNGTSGVYYDYPTGADCVTTDMANYGMSVGHPTDVGSYAGYASPYGTFDQGGNVWEWTEAILYGSYRGLRGGSIDYYGDGLLAAFRNGDIPTYEYGSGFHVAEVVPEPLTMLGMFLGLGSVGACIRKRRMV